jgi:hypothetical protein
MLSGCRFREAFQTGISFPRLFLLGTAGARARGLTMGAGFRVKVSAGSLLKGSAARCGARVRWCWSSGQERTGGGLLDEDDVGVAVRAVQDRDRRLPFVLVEGLPMDRPSSSQFEQRPVLQPCCAGFARRRHPKVSGSVQQRQSRIGGEGHRLGRASA